MGAIPYGKHTITQQDIDAVVEVLKSDFLTQGPKVQEFEKAFAQYVGSKYAVAVSNGTAALHLCNIVLGTSPGDKVITTPITFAATANSVRYCGGDVVFADIDPDTYLLDIQEVRKLLESAPKGTYKGIIPVDFAGRPIQMDQFRELADEFGCWLIEDACHAPGGYFYDKDGVKQTCGNGNYADLAIFSFHPVKHIAAGEGGMITTNNEEYYHRLLKLRTHGIVKDPKLFVNPIEMAYGQILDSTQDDYPLWYMELQELGFNYRLTDIQAALGLSQLKRAEEGIERRRKIAKTYSQEFEHAEYAINHSGDIEGHAYHLYVLETDKRLELYYYLRSHNVFAQVHYIPIHLMPYYSGSDSPTGEFPNAESYYQECLSLPMYHGLSDDEQNRVINLINEFFE